MKKFSFLFVGLIAIALLFSCEKEASDNDGMLKKGSVIAPCDPSVSPVIIEGANRGGNVTCAEVETSLGLDPGTFFCTDKVDYDGDFEGSFPEGINVEVTNGMFVQFWLDDQECIEIDGFSYKVGAVIVKGGPKANVYYYESGTTHDCGLSAPVNPSGKPAGLSNLTFCLVPCDGEEEDLVIAIKSFYIIDATSATGISVSDGLIAFTNTSYWCTTYPLGYNLYPSTTSFDMIQAGTSNVVGEVTVDGSGVVTITIEDGLTLDYSYVYVGTLSDLQNTNISTNNNPGCPLYKNWVKNDVDGQSQTFFN